MSLFDGVSGFPDRRLRGIDQVVSAFDRNAMIVQADREIDPRLVHGFFDLRLIFLGLQIADDQDHFHGIYRLMRHFQGDFHLRGE